MLKDFLLFHASLSCFPPQRAMLRFSELELREREGGRGEEEGELADGQWGDGGREEEEEEEAAPTAAAAEAPRGKRISGVLQDDVHALTHAHTHTHTAA